jgi:hypothetical protein
MKNTFIRLTILLLATFIFQTANAQRAEMTFKNKTHDFGKVKVGKKPTHKYKFTNTGDADLLIQNIGTTCGCTVASYPKTPIKPGKKGAISVAFNTEGKSGPQAKGVNIYYHGGEANLIVLADVIGGVDTEIPPPPPPVHDHSDPNHKH